jgi:hypothetical protein
MKFVKMRTHKTFLELNLNRECFTWQELHFNGLPNKTYAFRGESCHGGKMSKDRMTVLVGANKDGSEKLPLLLIGKSGKPRCFKNFKNLPCKYSSNKTAWMTSDLFNEYLKALDAKMGGKNRKIVLFIDNCPAHPKNIDHLSNVHVEFLPENSTVISQHMDQGVIKVLKTYFRKRLVHKLLLHVSSNTAAPVHSFKLSVLNVMHYLAASWEQVGPTLIANCFQKAGFHISPEVVMGEEEEECVQDEWDNVQEIFDFNGRFEDFIDVDDNVLPCSVQTVEQICEGDEMCQRVKKRRKTV